MFWKGDFDELKAFVESEVKLSGKWLSPGGEAKKFISPNFSLKWQGPKSKKLSVLEDDEDKYLETCLEGYAHTTNSKISEKSETTVEHVFAQPHVVVPEGEIKISTCENCKDLKPEINHIMSMFTKLQEKQDEECRNTSQRATESEAKIVNLILEHSNMAAEIESLKETVADLEIENNAIKNILDMKQNEWIKVDSKKRSPMNETEVVDTTLQTPVLYNSFSALGIQEPEEALTSFPVLDEDEEENLDSSQKTKVNGSKKKSKHGKVFKKNEQNNKQTKICQNKSIVIGDSMVKHIDSKKIERAAGKSVCHSYSGAKVNQINEKFKEHRNEEQYDCIILHVGTNDLVDQEAEQVAADMEKLIEEVKMHTTKVAISSVIERYDGQVNPTKINHYNSLVETLCSKHNINFINNNNIDKSFLNGSNLHLNWKGDKALGSAFCKYVKSFRVKTPNSVSVPMGENNQFFHHAYGHRNREWTLYLEYVSQSLRNK